MGLVAGRGDQTGPRRDVPPPFSPPASAFQSPKRSSASGSAPRDSTRRVRSSAAVVPTTPPTPRPQCRGAGAGWGGVRSWGGGWGGCPLAPGPAAVAGGRRCERARPQPRLSLPAAALTHRRDINSTGESRTSVGGAGAGPAFTQLPPPQLSPPWVGAIASNLPLQPQIPPFPLFPQILTPLPPSLPVSFHRNSTVATRPRAEGQRAQGGDNDYVQPPQKSSYLSAYPGKGIPSRERFLHALFPPAPVGTDHQEHHGKTFADPP